MKINCYKSRVFHWLCVGVLCLLFGSSARGQWVQTNGPYGGFIRCLAANGSNIYAGTYGGINISTNNGASWAAINNGLTELDIRSIVVDGSNLFAGTYGGGVFISKDSGMSWNAYNKGLVNRTILSLAGTGANLFAGTYGDGVFLSTDNGENWQELHNGLNNGDVRSLAIIGTNIFAGTTAGVFLSTDMGNTWVEKNIGLPTPPVAFSLAGKGANIFAGIYGAGVYRSSNNGATWVSVPNGMPEPYVFSLTLADTNLFAGAYGGKVYISTNNGLNWKDISISLTNTDVLSVTVNGNNLFAGTYSGVYLSTNNGLSWTEINFGIKNTDVQSFAVIGTNIFTESYGSGVFLSKNNGVNWTAVNNGLTYKYVRSLVTSGINLFAGIYGGGVFFSSDAGSSWIQRSNGLTDTDIRALAVSDINIFAAVYGGGMFHSSDNGISWSSVTNGLSNTFTQSLVVSDTTVFVGTRAGGVFKSTNYGKNWTDVSSNITNKDIKCLAVSGTNLFAGTNGGGVFISNDNGGSWVPINNGLTNSIVYSLVVNDTNIYAGTDNGGVFLTTNNGVNWSLVDSGLPNIDILSLLVNSPYLFAGTYGSGVWRIDLPFSPKIISHGPITFCKGGAVNLESEYKLYKTYQWFLNGNIIPGADSSKINAMDSGMYRLEVSDTSGRIGSSTIHIKVIPAPNPVIQGQKTACVNSTGLVYSVTLNPQRSYAWSVTPNGAITTGLGTNSITVNWTSLGAGILSITEKDLVSNCTKDSTFTVNISNGLTTTLNVTGNTSLCTGDSAILDAGAGYSSYKWSNGETSRTIIVKTAGNYSVEIQDAGGCKGNSNIVTITISPRPNPVIVGQNDACVNSTPIQYAVSPVASNSYIWRVSTEGVITSGQGSPSITVDWISAGAATVKVIESSANCSSENIKAVTLNSLPLPIITSIGTTALCEGEIVLLETGDFASYKWSSGETSRRISVTRAGIYNVEVADLNGCKGTSQQIAITVISKPAPTITQNGNELQSDNADSYQWLDNTHTPITGATSQTYTPSTNGTYYVLVTKNGCTGESSGFVFVNTNQNGCITILDVDAGDWIYSYPEGKPFLVQINNTSNQNCTVNKLDVNNPNFHVVGGQFPIEIAAGDTELIAMRYVPTGFGSESGTICAQTSCNNCNICGKVTGRGIDTIPNAIVTTLILHPSKDSVSVGEEFTVYLALENQNPRLPSKIYDWIGQFQYDGRVLYDRDLLPNKDHKIPRIVVNPMIGYWNNEETGDTLYRKSFLVKLADIDSIVLSFKKFNAHEGFEWIYTNDTDIKFVYRLIDSVVHIRVCKDDGKQYIRFASADDIKNIVPNPSTGSSTITLSIGIEGECTVSLVDIFGRVIQEVHYDKLSKGEHTMKFDESNLETGAYYVVMRTGFNVASQKVSVVR